MGETHKGRLILAVLDVVSDGGEDGLVEGLGRDGGRRIWRLVDDHL